MDNQDATTKILVAMAAWIDTLSKNGVDNIVALELLNEPWVFSDMSIVRDFYVRTITAIRDVSDIAIIVHDAFRHSEWDWLLSNFPFENVYMDTHICAISLFPRLLNFNGFSSCTNPLSDHAFNADDIASSTPNCDRNKIIVAENIACGYGSMLRFKTCVSLPTLVGEWSLAIDDCVGVIRGAETSVQFFDFGQCKNLKERIGPLFHFFRSA